MKKVLYIGGFELPDKNAAAQRVMANAKLLREMGFDVTFIGISKDLHNAPCMVDGFVSNPIAYPSNTRQWFYHIYRFIDCEAILKQKPDYVVLYNFPSLASLNILQVCRKNGIKVYHDITEWESVKGLSLRNIIQYIDIQLRMKFCLKRMDGIIAISRYLYNYYCNYTTTILIPPTVDLENSKFQRTRELSSSKDKIKLVYAGSAGLVATKDRLDYIIEAVNNFPNIQLDIVGLTKEQFQKIFSSEIIINNNVIFHGRVSHNEAVQFVCDADFQMLIRENTLKNKAGFPTKFVESFSCCTPIIATVTSNISDYLINGVNGFLVTNKCSLTDVFYKISNLSTIDIINMKKACKESTVFDYHNYKDEFLKLF